MAVGPHVNNTRPCMRGMGDLALQKIRHKLRIRQFCCPCTSITLSSLSQLAFRINLFRRFVAHAHNELEWSRLEWRGHFTCPPCIQRETNPWSSFSPQRCKLKGRHRNALNACYPFRKGASAVKHHEQTHEIYCLTHSRYQLFPLGHHEAMLTFSNGEIDRNAYKTVRPD